jgi:hypothetical protein
MKKAKNKITVDQILNMERHARRVVDIELGISSFTANKVHKSAKSYTRKQKRKVEYGD